MSEPIYVDASPLFGRRLTGIGRLVARLIDQLVRRTPLRLVTGFPHEQVWHSGGAPKPSVRMEIAIGPDNRPEDMGTDVHHWRNTLLRFPLAPYDAVRANECAGVYTFLRSRDRLYRQEVGIVFDFSPLLLPETHLEGVRRAYAASFGAGLQEFDKIIAISDATKTDAEWLYGYPAENISVAYPGPSQCVEGHLFTGPVHRRSELLLAVSTLEPRKNAPFLLDWFLTSPVLPGGSELWWAGPSGWLAERGPTPRHKVKNRKVRFLGMVSDTELCRLYQQASCTIYPSLYEGFGFPVLDSLLHNAPVLCSFNSSLAEFAGPGVFYFDPCEKASLDDAYRAWRASAPVSIERPDLRERCSWDRFAETVLCLAA
jgi:glycosyltransferase involved in cell wall biosynthesis